MKRYGDDFNEITGANAEKLRLQALDDLNNEIAGRDTGRIVRFISASSPQGAARSSSAGKDAHALSTLQLLLNTDPAYAALYRETTMAVDRGERLLDRAMRDAELTAKAKEEALDDVVGRAAKLPNGRAVFRDHQGRIRDQDGGVIDDALAASILWRGDEPDYTAYTDALDAGQAARDQIDRVRGAQVQIGDYRNRVEAQDNPPSAYELRDIKVGVERIVQAVAPTNEAGPASSVSRPEASIDVPKL